MMLQVERDRLHGKADLGHSAVVYSNKRRRIDVDTDDVIFHLKVKHTCSVTKGKTHLQCYTDNHTHTYVKPIRKFS